MRRAGALLLALWLSVSLVERAVPVPCALHDGAAAPATMAHHGAHEHDAGGHDSHDGTHQCRCLEQCAASAALALPGESPRAPIAPVATRDERRTPTTLVAPARTDSRLPFANGPPHALSA
jgi:hypothetical protein